MKNLFITCLVLLFTLSLSAQTTDKAAIQKAKELALKARRKKGASIFRKY